MNETMTLLDGPQGLAEWAYLILLYAIGCGLFGVVAVISYRSLYMDIWSARIDYVLLHCGLGALASVCLATCVWPGLRQTFIFTLVRFLVLVVTALYLSVTHRVGIPYHVPGYQRKPPEPEPDIPADFRRTAHRDE